jgi:2-C-methyl-D-erythritol 4-phosphate cytidylyltransferase
MNAVRSLAGVCVVIPAAGTGSRMSSEIPKQYMQLSGKTILQITLEKFLALEPDRVVLVVSPDDEQYRCIDIVESCEIVAGGAERSNSVSNGLAVLDLNSSDLVLVHDAVRPCVRSADILRLVESVTNHEVGGLLAVSVIETLKSKVSGVVETVDRKELWQAQTPQGFRYGLLRESMDKALANEQVITDESQAVESAGYEPLLVAGHRDNIKITEPGDIALAQFYMEHSECA